MKIDKKKCLFWKKFKRTFVHYWYLLYHWGCLQEENNLRFA